MPFIPLPTSLTDIVFRLDPATDAVLELGSGEGHFQTLLVAEGCVPLGLDLHHPAVGTACDLVGDARRPPVRPGSVALLVAANLVRHLVPRHRLSEFIACWRRLLRPGGSLFILEDAPGRATPAERNFRDLQAFLAQLMPETRGQLLPLARFLQMVQPESAPGQWTTGHQRNQETLDATEVMRLLSSGQGLPTGPVAGLIRSIGRDGLEPGRFWWACAGPGGSEA